MLAHAPHVAYTTFLVIFGCLGFLPVAALRAQLGPPALGVNLGYAITSAVVKYGGLGLSTHAERGQGCTAVQQQGCSCCRLSKPCGKGSAWFWKHR